MNPQKIREMLAQTLDDFRLSRGERSALGKILTHLDPSAQALASYRAMAFELARDVIDPSNSGTVIEWLEAVTKLLERQSAGATKEEQAEAHFSPGDDCPQRIRRLFQRARSVVDVCVFTVTDDRVSSAILDAHRRKVKVRIITDDDKSFDRGSDIARLSDAGIPVRIDRTDYHMHHKFALFDNVLLLTGSYNWTRSAAEKNEENFIITGDRRFIAPFSGLFDDLWERFG